VLSYGPTKNLFLVQSLEDKTYAVMKKLKVATCEGENLQNEASVLRFLSHPNICQFKAFR